MPEDFDLPFPHYRCPTCNKDLPLGEARMKVTCADHTEGERPEYEVRRATDGDRAEIEMICDRALGETIVDAFGKTFDVLASVNFIAELEGHMMGLLSLVLIEGEASIIFLSVYPEHQGTGAGSSLLKAAAAFAEERGLAFLRATATNDDIPLLYFYQRHGFTIYEVAVGDVADRFGSATPGFSSIPVRDEIRLRRSI